MLIQVLQDVYGSLPSEVICMTSIAIGGIIGSIIANLKERKSEEFAHSWGCGFRFGANLNIFCTLLYSWSVYSNRYRSWEKLDGLWKSLVMENSKEDLVENDGTANDDIWIDALGMLALGLAISLPEHKYQYSFLVCFYWLFTIYIYFFRYY